MKKFINWFLGICGHCLHETSSVTYIPRALHTGFHHEVYKQRRIEKVCCKCNIMCWEDG